ncbi:HD domain-containing protein [Haloarchaeobius salinus]|uniref:HD domain-containing protein n=1 Tax=Haloarchaeobius salinus TaxID=1198298 RepID=UPI00210C9011|nr:HD domain-containing protein [Haloarchaeobius salinus]
MKTIKDSVHDHIEVEGVARALLDTPEMQRLRHIKQLGTASLVYPSANHTRFEHSLGVYHNACEALDHLNVEGPRAEKVKAAALLHDVGHGPFSHNLEPLTHRRTGKYHDDVHELFERGDVATVLRAHDIAPREVADLVAGDGRFGQLVSGELDVDRMDYLVRDAHHTGVPYGTIDHARLVRELTFQDGELVLAEGNVQTAESLLVARALMTPTVYDHHVTRISKAMLRRAGERLLDSTTYDAEALRRMDDPGFLVALRNAAETAEVARRFDERDLYKRAVWAERADVPEDVLDIEHEDVRGYELEIAERAGVDPERVVLDVPGEPSMDESSTRVLVGGEARRLDEQSPLVEALQSAQLAQWRLGVYSPADVTDQVGTAAVRVLGLDIDGALVTEVRGLQGTLDQYGQ